MRQQRIAEDAAAEQEMQEFEVCCSARSVPFSSIIGFLDYASTGAGLCQCCALMACRNRKPG